MRRFVYSQRFSEQLRHLGIRKVHGCRTAQKNLCCHERRCAWLIKSTRYTRNQTLKLRNGKKWFVMFHRVSYRQKRQSGQARLLQELESHYHRRSSWSSEEWCCFPVNRCEQMWSDVISDSLRLPMLPAATIPLLQAHGASQTKVCKLGHAIGVHTTGDLSQASKLDKLGISLLRWHSRTQRVTKGEVLIGALEWIGMNWNDSIFGSGKSTSLCNPQISPRPGHSQASGLERRSPAVWSRLDVGSGLGATESWLSKWCYHIIRAFCRLGAEKIKCLKSPGVVESRVWLPQHVFSPLCGDIPKQGPHKPCSVHKGDRANPLHSPNRVSFAGCAPWMVFETKDCHRKKQTLETNTHWLTLTEKKSFMPSHIEIFQAQFHDLGRNLKQKAQTRTKPGNIFHTKLSWCNQLLSNPTMQ